MKVNIPNFVAILMIFFFLTFLRTAYTMIIGILPLVIYIISPYKLSLVKVAALSLLLLLVVSAAFYSKLTPYPNTILSLYLTIPIILLLIATPKGFNKVQLKILNKNLTKYLNLVMVVSNLFGLIQLILFQHGDAYIGLYGRHSIGLHGLALVNSVFFTYYFAKYYWLKDRTRKTIFFMFFYFAGHFLGFFGLGTLILLFVVGVVLVMGQFSIKMVLRISIVFGILTYGLYLWNPLRVFEYMISNLVFVTHVFENNIDILPGKIVMYVKGFQFATKDIYNFMFGVGPGGFNSRASFLLNADSDNVFTFLFGNTSPFWHEKVIHPLWDMGMVDVVKFNDGTRNQPFSSLISLMCEYGALFTLLVSIVFYIEVKKLKKRIGNLSIPIREKKFRSNIVSIVALFLALNLIGDNLFEMSECMLAILFLFYMKLYVSTKEKEDSLSSAPAASYPRCCDNR